MRILYVAPQQPSLNGIVNYAERFQKLLHQYSNHRAEFYVQSSDTIECEKRGTHLFNVYRQVKAMIDGKAIEKYDVVHAEIGVSCYLEFFYTLLLGLLHRSIPIMVTVHDPPHVINHPIQYFGLAGWSLPQRAIKRIVSFALTRLLEAIALRRCSMVFVLSEKGRGALRRRFPAVAGKITTIAPFTYQDADVSGRPACLAKDSVILSAGFWSSRRGLDVLLDALEILRSRDAQAFDGWSVIVGGGILDIPSSRRSHQEFTRRVAAGKWGGIIQILETMSIASYEELFRMATIYVSTDLYKNDRLIPVSGNLVRAVGCGCAVIASDAASNSELIVDSDNGYVYPSGDAESLAQALQMMMMSTNTSNAFAQRNRCLGRTLYSGRATVETVSSFYGTAGSGRW
ncbi:MAG: glycosyltransferase family 4 protein [Candidatus Edwardsbacteria bacterium]|nr:glycosyltransferase family 4 protein [Candidatus Edwardsbacteria bacterium]